MAATSVSLPGVPEKSVLLRFPKTLSICGIETQARATSIDWQPYPPSLIGQSGQRDASSKSKDCFFRGKRRSTAASKDPEMALPKIAARLGYTNQANYFFINKLSWRQRRQLERSTSAAKRSATRAGSNPSETRANAAWPRARASSSRKPQSASIHCARVSARK